MISVVRVEAVGDDPAQVKAEIDAILNHIRITGFHEGIVPERYEIRGEVYEVRDPNDVIEGENGGQFVFPYQGRKIVSYYPMEFQNYAPQMPYETQGYEVILAVEGSPKRDVTKDNIVSPRELPMDWPQQFRPRPFIDEHETVLYELRQMGMTCTIKPLPDPQQGTSYGGSADRWRIDVEYSDGRAGYHTVGPTILAAATDALNQAKGIITPPSNYMTIITSPEGVISGSNG